MALGIRTKSQIKIRKIITISAIHKFWENILETPRSNFSINASHELPILFAITFIIIYIYTHDIDQPCLLSYVVLCYVHAYRIVFKLYVRISKMISDSPLPNPLMCCGEKTTTVKSCAVQENFKYSTYFKRLPAKQNHTLGLLPYLSTAYSGFHHDVFKW